tara:strand:+ start:236 stop:451 length:216 start_codon:yes stop_codon:yes gene_type:complete
MPSIDKVLDMVEQKQDIVSRPSPKKAKKKIKKLAPPFMSAGLRLASMALKKNRNAKPVGPIAKYFHSKRQK